jgi:hypothetical protein
MSWSEPKERVLTKFHRWERKAKKENSDTLANILEEQKCSEE